MEMMLYMIEYGRLVRMIICHQRTSLRRLWKNGRAHRRAAV